MLRLLLVLLEKKILNIMILYIDYRESWFIQKLKDLTDTSIGKMCKITIGKNILECIVTNLEVGDFVIGNSLDNDIHLVIERKTYDDLASSITDGRFRQQKQRLIDSIGDLSKILYILEGHKKTVYSNSTSKNSMINGAILNLILKHQFKVVTTDNHDDSFNTIISIYKKCKEKLSTNENTVAPTRLISKGESISHNLFALQLSVIPGISYRIASQITEVYKNMNELTNAYNNCVDVKCKINMLSHLQISEKRKLGKALSKKIYDSIHE